MPAAAARAKRNGAAVRQKRWRARQKAGRLILSIEADEVSLTTKLIDLGRLNPLCADDPQAIGKALQKLVEELVVADVYPERNA